MGYCSQVHIAVDKSIVVQDLISLVIPECLKKELHFDTNDARHWLLDDWKWYDSSEDVQAIAAFFAVLEEMPEIPYPKEPDSSAAVFTRAVFGAMKEEQGDIETWGVPSDYNIYSRQYISSPVRN